MPEPVASSDAHVSENTIDVSASPEQVFDVLDDAYAYSKWVVGARRIRSVDPEWPAVGTRFHHAVGVEGAELHDWSRVCERDRPRHLDLEVRFRPTGIARVTIDVEPTSDGARILLGESPTGGPAALLPAWVSGPLLRGRNWLSLQRLRHEVERRATRGGSGTRGDG